MNLKPNQEIGQETHHDSDQFIYILSGTGVVILWLSNYRIKNTYDVFPGVGITIPSGTPHNVPVRTIFYENSPQGRAIEQEKLVR